MCGRYQFSENESVGISRIIRDINAKYGGDAWRPGEIRPTAAAPVLIPGKSAARAELFSWGFRTPRSLVINARAETAMEKPLFRRSVGEQRCIIPSTGFYEWDSEKRKYFFTVPGETELFMAGLYAVFDGKPCYCILTTGANESMREIHNRMPLVLIGDQMESWLNDPKETLTILRAVPPKLERVSMEAQTSLW